MFDQKYLFKSYLEKLSKLRSETRNPVYKKAFKLQSNSLFGKTLQNPLSYADDYHFYYSEGLENEENLNAITSKISERNYKNKPFLFKDIKIFKSKWEKLASYFYLAFSKTHLDQLFLFLTVWHNLLFF